MTFEQALKVRERIACSEVGYPLCEARYVDTAEWEKEKHMNWNDWAEKMRESFCYGEDIY